MESTKQFQVLGNAICISLHANDLEKGTNLCSPLSYGEIGYRVKETGFFSFGLSNKFRKKKGNSNQHYSIIKLTLSHFTHKGGFFLFFFVVVF